MAETTERNLKLYYSIKEVAAMFEVNESTLRYWQKVFTWLKPKTLPNGTRQYTKEDIEEIRLIHNLVKVRGYRLEAAKKCLESNRHGADKSAKILTSLISARDELKILKKQLDEIV